VKLARIRKTKAMYFLSSTEDRSKDKYTLKNKHYLIQTEMLNVFVTVKQLYGTQGKRERKRE
jgi:hypothetical protein